MKRNQLQKPLKETTATNIKKDYEKRSVKTAFYGKIKLSWEAVFICKKECNEQGLLIGFSPCL